MGRPSKLDLRENALSAIFYMRHDSAVSYESDNCNYSRSIVIHDILFVTEL